MTDREKTQELKRLASELYEDCRALAEAVGEIRPSDLADEPDELMEAIADGIVGVTHAFGRLGDAVKERS